MKTFVTFIFVVVVLFLPVNLLAAPRMMETIGTDEAVFHGGGCRKSSPPGQCCHAGSKPYHCH